jgi:hypothetical protein
VAVSKWWSNHRDLSPVLYLVHKDRFNNSIDGISLWKSIGIVVVKTYCVVTKICKNRNSFCYRLNAIKCTVYLRKVTSSVTYTVKTGTLYCTPASHTLKCASIKQRTVLPGTRYRISRYYVALVVVLCTCCTGHTRYWTCTTPQCVHMTYNTDIQRESYSIQRNEKKWTMCKTLKSYRENDLNSIADNWSYALISTWNSNDLTYQENVRIFSTLGSR